MLSRLRSARPRERISIPDRGTRCFFLLKGFMKSLGFTKAYWRPVPEVKVLEVEAIYLSPAIAEIRNATARTSLWCTD